VNWLKYKIFSDFISVFCIHMPNCSFFGYIQDINFAMAKDTGKCGNCDCAAGTCAKENGGKSGNCDCTAGTRIACISSFAVHIYELYILPLILDCYSIK
jgi:hypothetical protein